MIPRLPAAPGSMLLLGVLIGAGPAAADPITGTEDNDVLTGTPRQDTVRGLAGNDDMTAGKGADRAFGGGGQDVFRWANGDGRDRIDGGPDEDTLEILTLGQRLRLHIDALDGGPLVTARDGLQAIGVRALERIDVLGAGGEDRLVLSTDRGILPGVPLGVMMGGGNDRLDVREMRIGAEISPGGGNDVLRLGRKGEEVVYEASSGHDTIYHFGEGDRIVLLDPNSFQSLDTNLDGRVDRQDITVTVRDGSMTVDLAPVLDEPPGPTSITFVDRTSLSFGSFLFVGG